MKLRIGLALIAALILMIPSNLLAQAVTPCPGTEAGIRGYGTIKTPNGAVGAFSVNVVRRGAIVCGYFRYWEMSATADSYRRGNYVYTKEIRSLSVTGNTAVVEAYGVFNNQPANLTFEGLDDNPSGDWIRITAAPIGPLPYIWSVAGGLASGDICVWHAPPGVAFAKGHGAIAIQDLPLGVAPRKGFFSFYARPPGTNSVSAYKQGYLFFTDGCPTPASAADHKFVRICVRRLHSVVIDGHKATMSGKGTMNGKPCYVEATAIDNSMWVGPEARPDFFEIRAFTSNADAPVYQASGPVIQGDIVVYPGMG